MKRVLEIVTVILALGVMRIYMDIPNIHPIGAIALFGGAMLASKRFSLLLTFAVLFLSDVVLGMNDPLSAGYIGSISMAFTYAGFLAMVLIGQYYIRNNKSIARILIGSVSATVIFFVLSNLGAWLYDPMYAKTFEGAIAALVAGLPFIRYTAVSVVGGTVAVFALHHLYEMIVAAVYKKRASAVREK